MNVSPKRIPRVWVQIDRIIAFVVCILTAWGLADLHLPADAQAVVTAQAWLTIGAAVICALADSIVLWRPRAALSWPLASSFVLLAVWVAAHYLSGLLLLGSIGIPLNSSWLFLFCGVL